MIKKRMLIFLIIGICLSKISIISGQNKLLVLAKSVDEACQYSNSLLEISNNSVSYLDIDFEISGHTALSILNSSCDLEFIIDSKSILNVKNNSVFEFQDFIDKKKSLNSLNIVINNKIIDDKLKFVYLQQIKKDSVDLHYIELDIQNLSVLKDSIVLSGALSNLSSGQFLGEQSFIIYKQNDNLIHFFGFNEAVKKLNSFEPTISFKEVSNSPQDWIIKASSNLNYIIQYYYKFGMIVHDLRNIDKNEVKSYFKDLDTKSIFRNDFDFINHDEQIVIGAEEVVGITKYSYLKVFNIEDILFQNNPVAEVVDLPFNFSSFGFKTLNDSTSVIFNNSFDSLFCTISYADGINIEWRNAHKLIRPYFGSITCNKMSVMSSEVMQYDKNIALFPNPCHNKIFFKNSSLNNLKVQVLNSTGKKIREATISNNSLDVSDLSLGVYFIVSNSDNIRFQSKFLKL